MPLAIKLLLLIVGTLSYMMIGIEAAMKLHFVSAGVIIITFIITVWEVVCDIVQDYINRNTLV